MEFAFSDEQEMIRESVESFFADVSDSAAVRAAMASERGYDPALWQRLCTERVWPAIHIPEQYGGLEQIGVARASARGGDSGQRAFPAIDPKPAPCPEPGHGAVAQRTYHRHTTLSEVRP